jgi:hypothetical protein
MPVREIQLENRRRNGETTPASRKSISPESGTSVKLPFSSMEVQSFLRAGLPEPV